MPRQLDDGHEELVDLAHDLDEAERCHRVALIHAGRLAALGTTAEVKQIFKGRPIVEVRAPQAGLIVTRSSSRLVRRRADLMKIACDSASKAVRKPGALEN